VNGVARRPGDRRRSMSGSDRCFASPNVLTCGDPLVVGRRRPAPASLCARQPPQSAFRRHSLPRVCHAGLDPHKAARGQGDQGTSSIRIGTRRCARRWPAAVVVLHTWVSLPRKFAELAASVLPRWTSPRAGLFRRLDQEVNFKAVFVWVEAKEGRVAKRTQPGRACQR
jgi:hypothetical protein